MPLTILPQISSVGFTSQYHSVKPQPYKGKGITPQGNPSGKILNNQIESNTAKTISKDNKACLLYTSPSPRDRTRSRMPSSA